MAQAKKPTMRSLTLENNKLKKRVEFLEDDFEKSSTSISRYQKELAELKAANDSLANSNDEFNSLDKSHQTLHQEFDDDQVQTNCPLVSHQYPLQNLLPNQ